MSLRRSDQHEPRRENESSKVEEFLSADDGKEDRESQIKRILKEHVY